MRNWKRSGLCLRHLVTFFPRGSMPPDPPSKCVFSNCLQARPWMGSNNNNYNNKVVVWSPHHSLYHKLSLTLRSKHIYINMYHFESLQHTELGYYRGLVKTQKKIMKLVLTHTHSIYTIHQHFTWITQTNGSRFM